MKIMSLQSLLSKRLKVRKLRRTMILMSRRRSRARNRRRKAKEGSNNQMNNSRKRRSLRRRRVVRRTREKKINLMKRSNRPSKKRLQKSRKEMNRTNKEPKAQLTVNSWTNTSNKPFWTSWSWAKSKLSFPSTAVGSSATIWSSPALKEWSSKSRTLLSKN